MHDVVPSYTAEGVPLCVQTCPSYQMRGCQLGPYVGPVCQPAVARHMSELVDARVLIKRLRELLGDGR